MTGFFTLTHQSNFVLASDTTSGSGTASFNGGVAIGGLADTNQWTVTYAFANTPEPASFLLAGAGILAAAWARRRSSGRN